MSVMPSTLPRRLTTYTVGSCALLDGEGYHQLVASLDELTGAAPLTERAAATAAAALPWLVARSFAGVRDQQESAGSSASPPRVAVRRT